jgi:hypothetical protein
MRDVFTPQQSDADGFHTPPRYPAKPKDKEVGPIVYGRGHAQDRPRSLVSYSVVAVSG